MPNGAVTDGEVFLSTGHLRRLARRAVELDAETHTKLAALGLRDDTLCALALARAFEHWAEWFPGEGPIAPDMALLRRYVAFAAFAAGFRRDRGFDAGVEQQLFQILESAIDAGVSPEALHALCMSERLTKDAFDESVAPGLGRI